MGDVASLVESELTQSILRAFYSVHTCMGHGFLEPVYQRSMFVALTRLDLKCEREVLFPVFYDGVRVGDYRADLLVERKVLVELKCAEQISRPHLTQLLNYLKAANIPLGLLLNFGPRAQVRRLML